MKAQAGFLRLFVKSSDSPYRPALIVRHGHRQPRGILRAIIVVFLGIAFFSCGSGHAILEISAPSAVVAGAPFSATVTAIYMGKRDTIIDGPIHFTTTDAAAHLPTLYVFTAADAGSHTFTGLTLVTPGSQIITVSDYDATPIAGSANVMVTAAAD